MSESIPDIRRRLEELEDRHEVLHAASLKMVRAVTSQSFIIPNGGARRDRAIAAWDALLAALGLKPGDLSALREQTEAGEDTQPAEAQP